MDGSRVDREPDDGSQPEPADLDLEGTLTEVQLNAAIAFAEGRDSLAVEYAYDVHPKRLRRW